MRRNSKNLITLALVSSVAAMALMPANSEAQRNRRAQLPSVEIHLEVLNSLQRTRANRQMVRQQAAPSTIRAVPEPAYTGDSFASEVARNIPSAVRAPVRNERIVQQLPKNAARPIVAARSDSQVVIQKLPSRNAVRVEPSEEQIVMQPIPQSAKEFAIAGSEEMEVTASPVVTVPDVKEKKSSSFFGQIADFFTGDKAEDDIPELIEKPAIQALSVPRTIASGAAPTAVAQAPVVAGQVAAEGTGSFFSTLQDELNGSVQFEQPATASIHPQPINPSEEMVAQIVSPELESSKNIPAVKAIPQPIVRQRYEERLEEVAPEAQSVKVETVPALQPIQATPVPAEMPKAKVIELDEPERVSGLPVPSGFVIAEKVNEAGLEKPSYTPPKKLEEPTMLQQRKVVMQPIPAPIEVVKPVIPKVTANEDDFPRLSEVENASSPNTLEELPKSAQEWLEEDSAPAPTAAPASPIAEMLAEVPKVETPVIQKPTIVSPVVQAPVVESPKVVEWRDSVGQKAVEKPVIESPVIDDPEMVELPEIEPSKSMTDADESFLNSALELDDPELVASLGEEKSMMEKALEEVEPVVPDAPAAAPVAELEEELALLIEEEPASQVLPTVASDPAEKEGMFPGITKTFKGLLGDEQETAPVAAPSEPTSSVSSPVISKEETAKNVLPPELPVAGAQKKNDLPAMDLLDEEVGNRFLEDELGLPELEMAEPKVAVPPPVVEEISTVPTESESTPEEFEVASLPPEPKATPSPVSTGSVANLRIAYGADDTDIPDAKKAALVDIAKKAKAAGKRVIISSFASGEEDESKAANMISLSRGLSLRAFFIDNGIAMDRIIVQAKGLENAGGPEDRADISVD